MKANMSKILPIFASVGVGIAAYQMLSGNGGKSTNMMPVVSNMLGMGTGTQGQNQQQ
ncbi:hypothetical protein [Ureibacillus aquaedulcis]|uniref:Uncharacterized protein n=1 Tax=Ureibacillus aquaedulcis TaxID=3058421 RepID=A0ABT8GSW0_9BACL|nr:hypothetical protein [Ureibacillus sp. BA0131]MDN4494449.1 hypothetical protein [Ureibacillus sp. BA0131]